MTDKTHPTDPQGDLAKRFFRTVKEGDMDGAGALLSAAPLLVAAFDPDFYGGTALNIASSRGDLAMLDLLLEHGGDIDQKSEWWAGGFAPIHSIFWSRHDTMGPALIERGATVDAHAAAGFGMIDRLTTLLDQDPSLVGQRGGDGQFPLHFAATTEVAGLLLDRGADIDALDVDHVSSAAQWAARDRPAVTRYLIDRGARTDPFMLTAVGDVGRLGLALDEDPGLIDWRINAEHYPTPGSEALHIFGYTLGWEATLLHAAARRDQTAVVHLLIDRGFDPARRGDYDESTALHTAAWEGSASAAEALLDRGAPIDIASGDTHENEPLGWAIVAGQSLLVRLLLDRGAPIHDHHVRNAAAGVAGEFQQWSSSPLETWSEIATMLEEGAH